MAPDDLIDVLTTSQRLGFLGARPIPDVVTHASGFVEALDDVTGNVVDLGSGGGVPGFVIASHRPDLHVTLVDRRTKRTDFLERMVHKYGLQASVTVRACDTDELLAHDGGAFDAAVARGFGPPLVTLTVGAAAVALRGRVVISEPPDGDRWDPDDIRRLGVERVDGPDGVVVFERTR